VGPFVLRGRVPFQPLRVFSGSEGDRMFLGRGSSSSAVVENRAQWVSLPTGHEGLWDNFEDVC